MQPSVVLTFCRAMVAAKLPYTSVFRNTAKVWAATDRIVWEFETHGMPGPALAPTTASTTHYRWFHCGADLTLIGLFTAGRMLRTCSETVGMQPGETPYAFSVGLGSTIHLVRMPEKLLSCNRMARTALE